MQAGQGSRRPAESAFKQQKLKAWQPILTPKWVIGCFSVVGTIFIPIGIAVMLASKSVLEYKIPYGANTVNCPVRSTTGSPCTISFTLPNQAGWNTENVFVYYELDNFYQNHRRYVQSRAALQLSGDDMSLSSGQNNDLQSVFATAGDCQGFVSSYQDLTPNASTSNTAPTVYMYPCGLVAGSRFNDTIYIQSQSDSTFVRGWETSCQSLPGWSTYPCPRNPSGVAWPSDVAKKFNSPNVNWIARNCRYIGGIENGFIDPALWNSSIVKLVQVPPSTCNLQPSDFTGPPCGYRVYNSIANPGTFVPNKGIYNCWQNITDEDFIVWMRVAALPTFRKLYRKIPSGSLQPNGVYNLIVHDRFPVELFGGSKSIVLSTTTWIGGKNDFLGSAYIAVGAICIGLALAFLAKHLISPRKLGDPAYLDFNK